MKTKLLISGYSHSPILFILWEYLNALYLLRGIVTKYLFGLPRRVCQKFPHYYTQWTLTSIWKFYFNAKWCRMRHSCCSWWRVSIYCLFKTWNKPTFRISFILQKLIFLYCLHIFQFWKLKWLHHQTSLNTWEIPKIPFCLNSRYQMSQQVNHTSAACGLANSLCSTLFRLIGRPFAFDMLLHALQDRAQVQNILGYAIAWKTTKNKASSLTAVIIKQTNKQNPINPYAYLWLILQICFFGI